MNALDLQLFYALLALVFVVLWTRGPHELRITLVQAALTTLLAVAFCAAGGALWWLSSHAEASVGHAHLAPIRYTSFPSMPVAVTAAIAFALLTASRQGWMGLFLLALALLVGWAGVFTGAYYPSDVIAALAAALIAHCTLSAVRQTVGQGLTPCIEQWYRKAFRRLIAAGYFRA